MSASSDPKVEGADEQSVSSESKLSQQGPEITTDSKDTQDNSTVAERQSSFTEMATSAAAGVKDNMFSMFGGGAKKEKKEETPDDPEEASGSSKAKKDADAEAEVSLQFC